MLIECLLCSRGIEHCHGTLVQHVDATLECTDSGCEVLTVDQHELVLECWQVTGGCGCAQAETVTKAAS